MCNLIKDLNGTDFDKKVWNETLKIPKGETKSYKDIAVAIGHPKAYRAVANALGRNPLPVLIPCHRVILSDGKVGGYNRGSAKKAKMLKSEGANY